MVAIVVLSFFGNFAVTQPAFAAMATTLIKGTAEGSTIAGEATFTEANGGLDVDVKVSNVPPGKHGFHIHEKGDCSDMGKAAGGHYNPDGVMHGLVMKDGFAHAHAGDFGNIEVAADGTGALKTFIPGLALIGEKYNVTGKAVILHEKEDDFSQPTGNAGGRIGCGIITSSEMPKAADTTMDKTTEAADTVVNKTTEVTNTTTKEISTGEDKMMEKIPAGR